MKPENKEGGLGEKILVVMTRTKKQIRQSLQRVAGEEGLSPNEIEVLLFLSDGGHDTARSIAQSRGMSPSLVSKSVESLLSRGYIAARQDEKDRRVTRLQLLPKAEQCVAELNRARKEFFGRLCRNITHEETAAFQEIIRKLTENLEELERERNS